MATDDTSFSSAYGDWAVISGGSDGLGAAFAEEIAARGVNLVLVARRQGPLDALAAELEARHGIKVRPVSLDLSEPEAARRLDESTADLDLGLIVFNAGSDAGGDFFLDPYYSQWQPLLSRNINFLTEALYLFGRRLRAKQRGGMIVVGSEAAFGGGARGALYTATKGYALNLAESLWAELRPDNVDVLTLLFGITDTPTLRSVLARKGIPIEATGAVPPAQLAVAAIEALGTGPVLNFDEQPGDTSLKSANTRRERVIDVSNKLAGFHAAPD